MLKLTNLFKKYSGTNGTQICALNKISLEIKKNDFVILVGENGAGKSTLFSVLTGAIKLDGGNIYLDNEDLSNMPDYRRSQYFHLIHQNRSSGLPQSLTVKELLILTVESNKYNKRRLSNNEILKMLDDIEPGFSRAIDLQIWNLSGGEYQLLNLLIIKLLIHDNYNKNKILLLDEHVSQLSPNARDRILEQTKKIIVENEMVAILSTHSEYIATTIGNRQVILSKGEIVGDYKDSAYMTSPMVLRSHII